MPFGDFQASRVCGGTDDNQLRGGRNCPITMASSARICGSTEPLLQLPSSAALQGLATIAHRGAGDPLALPRRPLESVSISGLVSSLSAGASECIIATGRSDPPAHMSNDVLECWFDEAGRAYWFEASPDFDDLVRRRLGDLHADAVEGRLDHWKDHSGGALALCILFDQVPRNIFRGSARAFATDAEARHVARRILTSGFDRSYPTDDHRVFCYLPFEHSEDIDDQRLALRLLTERTADECAIESARRHLEIISRFGRFPHRNAVLGRMSTSTEVEFEDAGLIVLAPIAARPSPLARRSDRGTRV
jgi:uncharacterized protein (DUF924 family)